MKAAEEEGDLCGYYFDVLNIFFFFLLVGKVTPLPLCKITLHALLHKD